MTHPAPQAQATEPSGPPPKRLAFITVPLLISLFLNAFTLLELPFTRDKLNESVALVDQLFGRVSTPMSPEMVQFSLWLSFFILVVVILWLYNTRRAVLSGKSWGRTSTVVIGIVSLLLLPVGTLLGIVMLIGAFDRDVTNYLSRK